MSATVTSFPKLPSKVLAARDAKRSSPKNLRTNSLLNRWNCLVRLSLALQDVHQTKGAQDGDTLPKPRISCARLFFF